MIAQFLQTALEFFKEIWFQLDSQFGLEDTEAFKFLKPYLIQLQDDPLYMGISLAALFLVPYGLIKIRSISREREQKLDELMEEMEEEEYDEDDPRRLRRPEPEPDEEDDEAKPLFGDDEASAPSYMKVLDDIEGKDIAEEDFEAELEEFELEPSSDSEETVDSEKIVEPVSSLLTENEFDKELNEFMTEEPDWEKEENDVVSELNLDDSSHDEATKELQEEELMKLDEELSAEDPLSNYSELDEDEQDKAIKDLQKEMERTINQPTQQIDEPTEIPSSIKDLSEIHIGGDATIDEEFSPEKEYFLEDSPEKAPDADSPDSQSEAPTLSEESSDPSISELSDSEILASLEPGLEAGGLEPERKYSSPEETDSLIDRLKFLQTRFENRYQPLEPAGSPTPIEKKISDYSSESLAEPRRYTSISTGISPDSKKYMDLLESFIFMKDQKKI
ncbi:MAG TPA: hypothetical protein EYQ03_08010, partial [Nitrospinaceae bacterium]|nr:hypothetical protein [Nitrospinaceae bacterium]